MNSTVKPMFCQHGTSKRNPHEVLLKTHTSITQLVPGSSLAAISMMASDDEKNATFARALRIENTICDQALVNIRNGSISLRHHTLMHFLYCTQNWVIAIVVLSHMIASYQILFSFGDASFHFEWKINPWELENFGGFTAVTEHFHPFRICHLVKWIIKHFWEMALHVSVYSIKRFNKLPANNRRCSIMHL